MKDAFDNKLFIGDTVVYARVNSFGTTYVLGEIAELLKHTNAKSSQVRIRARQITRGFMPTRDTIVKASNVVKVVQITDALYVKGKEYVDSLGRTPVEEVSGA